MASRGLWHFMSARTRRGLALSWTALFVLSLLLQYFSFAVATPTALAAHDVGIFELDGNAVDQATVGADWENGAEGSADQFFAGASTEASANDTTYFTTGGSKDENDIPAWEITSTAVPDKDELLDAYAAVYQSGGDTWVYFGADRFDNDGDAQIGFWFFQGNVGIANGDFTGNHVDGDVLVLSEYTNGGVVDLVCAYEWDGSGGGSNIAGAGDCDPATSGSNLNLVAAGAACDAADGTFDICARTNTDTETAPWTFTNKDGEHDFATGQFFEGGINLSDMFGGQPPCFGTFLAETRSSQETDAQLKDFAFGSLNTCVPPDITTQVDDSTADFGQQVTDTATLSGSQGPVTGTVSFFICTPAQITAAGCPTGGTQVGGAVTIVAGSATSAAYTVGLTAAAAGTYCWRAEYTPAASSDYLAATHTNNSTECFAVAPATIDIEKVANPAGPVSAGTAIGFDITVTNSGTNTTLGVNVSDNLPSGVDWTLGATSGSTTGLTCAITGSVGSEVLGCTKPSLAAGASFSVRVTANTDATDCGVINNTANVSTSNDGTDNDSASVVVQCPDVTVAKTPDSGTVNAGSNAVFTIVVTNLGPGTATSVTLTDNLPAGYTWTLGGADAASCSIDTAPNPDVLSCNFGDLADDATRTITLTAPTTGANCAVIPNTAVVAATNEPSSATGNNSDNGSIDVLCANVSLVKNANPVGPVNAGDSIGFDIVVTNNGDGTATGVSVTDPLPAGITWSVGAPTGDTTGVSCSIDTAPNPDLLTCTDASMPAGASFTVHISGATDAADCGLIDNTATVTTVNDGGNSDGASVMVNCPDVHVDKTADTGTISAGSVASFTITVSNAGPGIARSVTLSDTLPAGITWSENSASCSIAAGVLSCNFGDLAAGASASVTVSGTTDAADCGTLNNTATVGASNESTADQADNSDSAAITVQCPDVHVDKSTSTGTISAGQTASFTIVVSNAGPGTATNVTLNDPLPAGIAWSEDSTSCSITANVLSCNFGDLAAGATRTVTVSGVTDAADCATLNNTATVGAGNESTADQADNTDSASVIVQCPDLGVVKTADDDSISAGDVAGFTITVTNHGPGTAFNVHVADTLPAGIAWALTPAVPGCAIVGLELTCDFASLGVGAGNAISIHVSGETDAADCGTLPNLVNVSASNENTATDQFPNSDDASIVVNCPTIVLTKTADNAVINAGDPIGFTITVSNTGLGNATGVTVTDNLPAGITWTADAPTGDTTGVSCSINTAPNPDVLTCTDASMAPGDSFSVHIHGTTTPANCGLVDNTATVTTGNDGGDEDSSRVTVLCPDVTVVKTPDSGTVNAGDNATFTIVVSNSSAEGTGTAYGVTLTDNLPAGYTWSVGGPDGASCSIDTAPNPDVLSCSFGNLAAGASKTITLTAATTGANCAVIPNLASVSATNEAAAQQGNNSDAGSIDVLCADIDIEKTANPVGPVSAGEDIGFDITVSNDGDGNATGVVVTDELPSGIDWNLGAITGDTTGVECAITGSVGDETLTCTDASMAPEDSFSVHVSGTTDAADCGTVPNTASVVTGNDGTDSASASVVVLCPDIEVVKDAPNTPIPVGEDLVFEITVTNIGDGEAKDVVLTDTLPAGFDWSVDNEDCDIEAGVLTCNFGNMEPDESVTITLTAPTSGDPEEGNIDCGESLVHEIPNVASATASNEGDDVLENNEDDATITVLCSALVIDKSFTGNTAGTDPILNVPAANIGDTLHYTLEYTGAGPLTNAVITDVLPDGLDFVEGSPCTDASDPLPCDTDDPYFDFVGYDAATRTLTWTAATLPDPANGTVTYDVVVLESAPEFAQPLTNVATIDSDQTEPDSDTADVAVLAPPLELTPPPTSTIAPQTGTGNPGFTLMLILLGVAGLALGIGFVTPVPERVRRRDRLG